MTVAVISDIHANLPALRAVLADIDATAPNATIWHTGDIVGYNAHPNEVIELLHSRSVIGVMGNHDAAAVDVIDVLDFIADCVMAGMARSGSVYELRLSPELLEKAFQNTVTLLKENVQIAE